MLVLWLSLSKEEMCLQIYIYKLQTIATSVNAYLSLLFPNRKLYVISIAKPRLIRLDGRMHKFDHV